MEHVLSRENFRNKVFARDSNKCVVCATQAQDAHHIIERRLWSDGGYHLDNGASVCGPCHLKAEQTLVSCEELRAAAGIKIVALPSHLYSDRRYDKWGNTILPSGMRLPGELFFDESVQKVLAPVLDQFAAVADTKYPRTFHLPWSPSVSKDDRVMPDLSLLEQNDIVVTVKMDGENTTLTRQGVHARSLDAYNPHPSRVQAKVLWSKVGYELPEGWRLCGENLQGKHSIHYKNISSYFMGISLWNDHNVCLSWTETLEWFTLLEITPVPVLYAGSYDETFLQNLWTPKYNEDECEGYVVRIAKEFPFSDFRRAVGKYVRPNHVQTHGHWMKRFEENGLRKE